MNETDWEGRYQTGDMLLGKGRGIAGPGVIS